MLGYIRTSDTSQTGLRCPCTSHPAFYPRINWLRRVQIVWLKWSYQPWPDLGISHSRVTGPYVQLEPCANTWTGLQILGNKELFFVSFKKGFNKDISPATIFPWIKQTVILYYELWPGGPHSASGYSHDVRALTLRPSNQGSPESSFLSACHSKLQNTFTVLFEGCFLGWLGAWSLGPVVAAQQGHHQAQKWDV